MRKRIGLILITIMASTGKAFACYEGISLLNPFEWFFAVLIAAALVALSTPERRNVVKDTGFFTAFLVILLLFQSHSVVFPNHYFPVLMIIFTIYYTLRVRGRTLNDKRSSLLYAVVPLLLAAAFILPPPFTQLWCTIRCTAILRDNRDLVEDYCYTHGKYPKSLEEMSYKYVKDSSFVCVPPVPGIDEPKMWPYKKRFGFDNVPYNYRVSDDRFSYTLSCQSRNHEARGFTRGYPQYSSKFGELFDPADLENAIKKGRK